MSAKTVHDLLDHLGCCGIHPSSWHAIWEGVHTCLTCQTMRRQIEPIANKVFAAIGKNCRSFFDRLLAVAVYHNDVEGVRFLAEVPADVIGALKRPEKPMFVAMLHAGLLCRTHSRVFIHPLWFPGQRLSWHILDRHLNHAKQRAEAVTVSQPLHRRGHRAVPPNLLGAFGFPFGGRY